MYIVKQGLKQHVYQNYCICNTICMLCIHFLYTMTGWWYIYPSKKYEFVSWDDEIPNISKKNVPNHQPDITSFCLHCGTMIDRRYHSWMGHDGAITQGVTYCTPRFRVMTYYP